MARPDFLFSFRGDTSHLVLPNTPGFYPTFRVEALQSIRVP